MPADRLITFTARAEKRIQRERERDKYLMKYIKKSPPLARLCLSRSPLTSELSSSAPFLIYKKHQTAGESDGRGLLALNKEEQRKINTNYDGESGTDAWNCSICLH